MAAPRDPLPAGVLDALRRGDAIDAIKRLRASRELGFEEAKDRVEAHERVQAPTGLAPGEVPRSRAGWVGLVVLVALAVAGYALLA